MDYQKGYYALIQYCPDASRLEAANVGVLLFCPDEYFLRARLARDNSRLRRFFGPQDWLLVQGQKEAIEDRLDVGRLYFRTTEDVQNYIGRRANNIQISELRPTKVANAEKDLEELFQRLVGEAEQHQPTYRAATKLKKELVTAQVESLLERNITVDLPEIERSIEVPYAYRNGAYNLIKPVNFEAATFDQAFVKAATHAVEGQALRKHATPEQGPMKLIVVGEFGPKRRNDLPVVRSILESHDTTLHTLDRLGPLIQEIREATSHHLSLPLMNLPPE